MARTPFNAVHAATLGTAGTNCVADSYGTPYRHTTKITLTSVDVPDIAGGAALAVGALIYTFPAGIIAVNSAGFNIAIQQVDGNITADTPDVGLGTVIASGAVAVLSGTSTFEDILTGQTFDDCDGTAEVAGASLDTALQIAAAAAHTVHLNIADTWAASGDANATVSGTVWINWERLATA
jgi:hypothetical protein